MECHKEKKSVFLKKKFGSLFFNDTQMGELYLLASHSRLYTVQLKKFPPDATRRQLRVGRELVPVTLFERKVGPSEFNQIDKRPRGPLN